MRHWTWVALVSMLVGHSGLATAEGNFDVAKCAIAELNGDYDDALSSCDRALHSGDLSDSERADALNDRGIAYSGKGDYDRAVQDFDQAILLNPDDESPYVGRAMAFANQGRYDQAIESFDQALRLKPDLLYASLWRAQVLFELARFSDAAGALGPLADAYPELPEVALWFTLAQRRAGNRADETLKSRTQQLNLEIWPGPVVRLYLGQISRDAVQAAAGDADPKIAKRQSCQAAFYIAELDLVSGQKEAARPEFQHAIDTCRKGYAFARMAKAEMNRM